ncbi:RedB [Stieleria varia]|uniref:RedB n=1 Tax=Stieleria varia TaxID=2528005 RepID=UPI001E5918C0|nr:RedB [Stieleria varia]
MSTRFDCQPDVHAFAYRPQSETDSWIESRSTTALRGLADTQIHIDVDGKSCRRLGVLVSGHVLVYDGDGNLSFSGAITPYRGHEGDCQASSEFVRCVNGESTEVSHWPVFGCPIIASVKAFGNESNDGQ